MKPVFLFLEGDSAGFFDTVKEAQEYAEERKADQAAVYTLYSHGERTGISWKVQADTGTNLRTVKQQKTEGIRSGAWTSREVQTALDNYKAGMSITDIATALNRTYNSVYLKVRNHEK